MPKSSWSNGSSAPLRGNCLGTPQFSTNHDFKNTEIDQTCQAEKFSVHVQNIKAFEKCQNDRVSPDINAKWQHNAETSSATSGQSDSDRICSYCECPFICILS